MKRDVGSEITTIGGTGQDDHILFAHQSRKGDSPSRRSETSCFHQCERGGGTRQRFGCAGNFVTDQHGSSAGFGH
jgi:hypothetical protein